MDDDTDITGVMTDGPKTGSETTGKSGSAGRGAAGSDDRGERDGRVLQLSLAAGRSGPRAEDIVTSLRQYWESLRQGRAVPDRADVEPAGIRDALDYAFIAERIAPGAARFRLAGRHLVDLLGMEVRGMPVCSLFNAESRSRFSDVLETVFRGPQIAELRIGAEPGYQRPALSGRMLILPLKSDLGDVTRALGCLVAGDHIGLAPRRLDLLCDSVFPVIEGARPLEPGPGPIGFGEEPALWRPPVPRDTPAAPRPDAKGPNAIGSDVKGPHAKGPADSSPRRPNLPRPVTSPLRGDETPEERRARFRVVSDSEN